MRAVGKDSSGGSRAAGSCGVSHLARARQGLAGMHPLTPTGREACWLSIPAGGKWASVVRELGSRGLYVSPSARISANSPRQ